MKTRLLTLTVLIAAFLLGVAVPVVSAASPQQAQASLFTTIELLASAVGVGAVIAFLFERFAWF